MSGTRPKIEDRGPLPVAEWFDRLYGMLFTDGSVAPAVWNAALLDPTRSILSRSGKGVRARLVERAWHLAGGAPEGPPELLPVAIEFLHVGSLVIDDIQDDSRLRRGSPALHREYGVPIALNTGNWLYFLATSVFSHLPVSPDLRLGMFEDTSLALLRCHQGQALDLSVRVTEIARADVPALVASVTKLKTGALMRLSATLGARAAGAGPEIVESIGALGEHLGIGLQMLDDWSSIAVEDRREKGIEDIQLARPIWPWAWLAQGADEVAYARTIRHAPDTIDWEADLVLERLRTLLQPMAPGRIRTQLDRARAQLPDSCPADAVEALREDIDTLERAYG
jgi:geranylgeranyl pyrophosphate synthase